jgi:hypothetical protein
MSALSRQPAAPPGLPRPRRGFVFTSAATPEISTHGPNELEHACVMAEIYVYSLDLLSSVIPNRVAFLLELIRPNPPFSRLT